MGLLDKYRRRNKNPVVDDDVTRHHGEALDYFEEEQKVLPTHCPECAREQKHVQLVRTEGEQLECPECHYLHTIKRI